LFHQPNCTFEFQRGDLKVSTTGGQISSLIGTIIAKQCATVAEFVDRLNDQSTAAAKRRFATGQRPQMLRAAWRAATQFVSAYLQRGRFRGGWTGLQVAMLENLFAWIEEAKLYQLTGEFRPATSIDTSSDGLPARAADPHEASTSTLSKAA
jgi:hypothetical protein